jgi:hypothetical protein
VEHNENNEDLLARYLLGQLREPEQERIEQAYLADAEWQERLTVAEDELIDGYVRGTLAEEARRAFEKHFLNVPRRRERIAFAKALQQLVSEAPPVFPAASRWPSRTAAMLLLAATVLLLIGSAWLLVEATRLRRELARSQSERAALVQSEQQLRQQVDDERARSEALSQQLAELRANPQPQEPGEPNRNGAEPQSPVVVSFLLTVGLARDSGETQTLTVPRTAQRLRLQLLFRDNSASPLPNQPPGSVGDKSRYRALLRTPEGREVVRREGLKAQPKGAGRIVTLSVAPLASGDYTLILEGQSGTNDYEPVAQYAFTVIRK